MVIPGKPAFLEHLLRARSCSVHLTCVKLFHLHRDAAGQKILTSYLDRGSPCWEAEGLSGRHLNTGDLAESPHWTSLCRTCPQKSTHGHWPRKAGGERRQGRPGWKAPLPDQGTFPKGTAELQGLSFLKSDSASARRTEERTRAFACSWWPLSLPWT